VSYSFQVLDVFLKLLGIEVKMKRAIANPQGGGAGGRNFARCRTARSKDVSPRSSLKSPLIRREGRAKGRGVQSAADDNLQGSERGIVVFSGGDSSQQHSESMVSSCFRVETVANSTVNQIDGPIKDAADEGPAHGVAVSNGLKYAASNVHVGEGESKCQGSVQDEAAVRSPLSLVLEETSEDRKRAPSPARSPVKALAHCAKRCMAPSRTLKGQLTCMQHVQGRVGSPKREPDDDLLIRCSCLCHCNIEQEQGMLPR
jgi:hypothetical protein